MLNKMALLCAVTSLFVGNSLAQNGQGRGRFEPKSSIAVTADGLTCNNGQGTIPALTWSFGVSAPVSTTGSGGGGTTKVTVSDLSITRRADGCTPILFEDVVTRKHIKQVTIVQQDAQKDDVFTVTLQDVIIDSYQLGGDQDRKSTRLNSSHPSISYAV